MPRKSLSTRDTVYVALFAVLVSVCSWISIPVGSVPFTMQTFGVFCCMGLLGGAKGALAVLVYILLGAVGLPVFAGFAGGLGALMGATGGYIIGFLLSALAYGLITRRGAIPIWRSALGMVAGLIVCYAFGTAWFLFVYARGTGPISLGTALMWCVVPFILPDLAKIALALFLTERLKRHVHLD